MTCLCPDDDRPPKAGRRWNPDCPRHGDRSDWWAKVRRQARLTFDA